MVNVGSWEDVSDTDTDSELPMYFKEPQQLLDIFSALEESNLFLIQNSQETEEALEELKQKMTATEERMETQMDSLNSQIEQLKASISMEEDKARMLHLKASKNSGVQEQEQTLRELSLKVSDVYQKVGFEVDPNLGTLQMLTNIESKLEELLTTIGQMDPAVVERLEKDKQKQRRTRQMEQTLLAAQREQEERNLRSLRRSQEPVKKRTGKPVMFRSAPITRKKKTTEDQETKLNEEDDINFYLNLHSPAVVSNAHKAASQPNADSGSKTTQQSK